LKAPRLDPHMLAAAAGQGGLQCWPGARSCCTLLTAGTGGSERHGSRKVPRPLRSLRLYDAKL
jgi:hypothetical protein